MTDSARLRKDLCTGLHRRRIIQDRIWHGRRIFREELQPGPLQDLFGTACRFIDFSGHRLAAASVQRPQLFEEFPGLFVALEFVIKPALLGGRDLTVQQLADQDF